LTITKVLTISLRTVNLATILDLNKGTHLNNHKIDKVEIKFV